MRYYFDRDLRCVGQGEKFEGEYYMSLFVANPADKGTFANYLGINYHISEVIHYVKPN